MPRLVDATPEEIAYKEATWQQLINLPGISSLAGPELEALRAKGSSELDDHIRLARSEGISPTTLGRRRTESKNIRIANEQDVLWNG